MKKMYKGLLLAICSVGLSSLSWGQCFNETVSYGAGPGPSDAVVGDFNADGRPDLAVSNYTDFGTVSVLLATGNGSFSPATSFSVTGVPSNPISIVKGDFNGDGKLDLITANFGRDPNVFFVGSFSLLPGDGAGGFGSATRFNGGTNPSFVDVGDFNGDGRPDLIVNDRSVRGNGGYIYVLLNNGSGSFGAGPILTGVGRNLSSVAVGDFNGDGKSDLATANSTTNAVSVLLSNSGASFNPVVDFPIGSTPTSVVAGDINSDGKLDLVANTNTGTGYVLLGTGDGGFRVINTTFDGDVLVVGDLNGDGKPDLAGASGPSNNSGNTGGTISVLLGNGTGGFSPRTNFTTGSTPTALVADDFNGDGKLDLVTSNLFDNTVSLLLNCTNTPTPTGLTLAQPAYDCNTSQLTLATTGGNGQPIEYRIAGLRDWSSTNVFTIPTYQRTGTTFTLEVRQSGRVVSLAFTTACQLTPPTPPVPPVTPPTGSGLSLAAPAYDCNTGQLALSATGGNGQLVEYRVAGLRDWAAGNTFTVPTYQRTGTTFTLEARQSGQVVSLAFTSACQTTPPPVTPPTPPAGTPLSVSAQSLDCQTGALQLVTAGGDGTAVEFKVPGLRDFAASASFTVPIYQRSGTSFTLFARQSGREVTATYAATCPVGARLASPEATRSLAVVVYPNPVGAEFSVGISGAAGESVRFELTNLAGQTVVEQRAEVVSNQHTETLRMPASGSGMYLLRVSTNGQSQTVKVLKL
ncbi:MAG: T9SS type A sorting domain-containing protein [Bacteroidetes bacterium]|nr:T9SS type A sorting domain-containing protein [Fibrella sp.]